MAGSAFSSNTGLAALLLLLPLLFPPMTSGQLSRSNADDDEIVSRNEHELVYSKPHYFVASKHRDVDGGLPGGEEPRSDAFDLHPLPTPRSTDRHCEVHTCALIEGDHTCATGLPGCTAQRGHLRPMGAQWPPGRVRRLQRAAPGTTRARDFWLGAMSASRPLLMREFGTPTHDWSDASLQELCAKRDGSPWMVFVERNNRVVSNDRSPFHDGWDFCRFLRSYLLPENGKKLYTISPLTPDLPLFDMVDLPRALRCRDLASTVSAVRLWMSAGNTTSSLHFDTHENVLLQVSGVKEVILWHPNASGSMYMDFHDKFGLSPINVDRVDLERFPAFADSLEHALTVTVSEGDSLYIPDGWWHVVHSRGRNVALTFEFHPYDRPESKWPQMWREREARAGVYWAEKRRIRQALRERLSRTFPARASSMGLPVSCPADDPDPSEECPLRITPGTGALDGSCR